MSYQPMFLESLLSQCIHAISSSPELVFGLFVAGLAAGFTHCAFMCGPFVLSQTRDINATGIKKIASFALIPYHLGRITTYIGMAALFSSILNLAFLFMPIKNIVIAPIMMLAGLIFIVNAFPRLLAIFPWVAKIQISLPFRIFSNIITKLSTNTDSFKLYTLGILLGFMPCGMVISAIMATASADTTLQAILAMAAYGAGTMPALITVAFGGHALKASFPKATYRITKLLMAFSGIWLFAIAGKMLL